MVAAALSLTRSGLRDWIFQRISAVILGLYVLVLLGFFITHSPLTYDQWKAFFSYREYGNLQLDGAAQFDCSFLDRRLDRDHRLP